MRTDVKVGIALGAIVLIVAGAYYGANKDPDIQLAGADDDVREQNKRTLRDLLAPPPNTPTISRNKTRSTTAFPTPDTEPRALEHRQPGDLFTDHLDGFADDHPTVVVFADTRRDLQSPEDQKQWVMPQ